MKKKMLVTSALPYANGSIHIGHLVEYIQTDIFVRFKRLLGEDVIYCCADDTHGAPIEINAKKQGIAPEELIKKYHKEHQKDFKDFLIEFDSYYSTNSKENKEYSDLFFERLSKKALIYKKKIEQTYCENCKRFLPDRYVRGECPKCGAEEQYGDVCEVCGTAHKTSDLKNPLCAICGSPANLKESEHYFFKLSSFSEKLDKWLDKNKNLQPEMCNYVKNWIKDGLEDWDITRDGPYFGFKIPGEKDKYYYVWLDAPIGYISSTANYCKKHGLDEREDYWESRDSEIIHVIGKDITYFHFLFWPAMLMGADFNLPKDIVVHGFLTVNGEKMSKSRGTFYTAREFLQKYDPEYLRYYYANMISKKLADVDLNFEDLRKRVNTELVANLGNFCYRVTSFANKNFYSKIGSIEQNKKLIEEITKKINAVKENYQNFNFKGAVKEIMAISSLGNKYFQDNEPWKLIKEDKEKVHKIVGLCINIAKNLSIIVEPILPRFSAELQKQLKLKNLKWSDINFSLKNHKIGKEKMLIEKIGEVSSQESVFPLNLKVAKITNVEDHPNADKLQVLKIDLGSEQRQLVAGLKGYYKNDELKGKNIVVVTNLKPAKLRGVESKGMLLAADDGKNVKLLLAEKSSPGEQVLIECAEPGSKEISFEEFQKINIVIKDRKAVCNGKVLKTDKEEVAVDIGDGAKVR